MAEAPLAEGGGNEHPDAVVDVVRQDEVAAGHGLQDGGGGGLPRAEARRTAPLLERGEGVLKEASGGVVYAAVDEAAAVLEVLVPLEGGGRVQRRHQRPRRRVHLAPGVTEDGVDSHRYRWPPGQN